ncbi:DNA fragmentation factor subunit beta [Plecturocebus cupreus]
MELSFWDRRLARASFADPIWCRPLWPGQGGARVVSQQVLRLWVPDPLGTSAVLQKPKTMKRKFSMAGSSFLKVLCKGCLWFQLPEHGSWLCLHEDGIELTEVYFPSIPDNAELMLLTSSQAWQGYVSDIGRFLSAFHEPHMGFIQASGQLLCDEQRQRLLANLLHNISQNIAAETLAEDLPWFEGLKFQFRNKSGYLRYSCESQIRSYLREVSSYSSKKKECTVIPTLGEAVKEQDGREVNWEYFYGLLFISENLKLVYIVCNKKTTHKLNCDRNRIYKPQTRLKRKQPVQKCQ